MGRQWNQWQTIFLGSKISEDGDGSHEIKRWLVLGRKAKANLSSVQSLSCVWLFLTPWTAARQASLSITNAWNFLKLMSIKSVMPSNHLILCRPLLLLPSIFPNIRSFPVSQLLTSGGHSIGASASATVLPVNVQVWSPCCPRDSQESSPEPQFKNISSSVLCLLYCPALTSIHDYWKKNIALTIWTFVGKVMSLLFNRWCSW